MRTAQGILRIETTGTGLIDITSKVAVWLAEARLVEQAPVLPVVFNTNKYLMRPEVQGWHATLLDQHPLSAVRLVPTPAKGD